MQSARCYYTRRAERLKGANSSIRVLHALDIAAAASALARGSTRGRRISAPVRTAALGMSWRSAGGKPFAWQLSAHRQPPFTTIALPVSNRSTSLGAGLCRLEERGDAGTKLAVVVDDAAIGVTEVVRGDDPFPTPRQILLYRGSGLPPPALVTLSHWSWADGRRLAKRHGDALSACAHPA